MSPVPVSPRRVFGVDFSGSMDAGRHIWVCRAHPGDGGVRIESVERLCDLPGGGLDRETALGALVQKIIESPRSAWGFDFPFGLPEPIGRALGASVPGSFTSRLEAVARLGGADSLRAACRRASPGRELRRRTDTEAPTPWSPYNLRLYKQTFHGMTGVLLPLRGRAEVAALPFDPLPGVAGGPAGGLAFNRPAAAALPHVYLMEVCPASLLARLGDSRRGYKGGGESHAARRRGILRRLVDEEWVRPVERRWRDRIVADRGGDGLDAVLAAVGAWRGYRDHEHSRLRLDARYGTEGFVYT